MQSISYLWHGDHVVDTAKQVDTATTFEETDNATELFALLFDDWFEVATDTGNTFAQPVVAEAEHELGITTLVNAFVKSVAGQVSSRMSIVARITANLKRIIADVVNSLRIPYQRIKADIHAMESSTELFYLASCTTVQGGETMAFVGDTVRLQVNLRNYENQPVDIYDVTLKIIDESRELIEIITDLTRLNKGVFYFDYTVPNGEGDLVYEFEATNTNNKPVIARGKIARKFV